MSLPFMQGLPQESASDAFQVVASADALTTRRMAFVLAAAAGDVSNVEAGIEFCHRGLGGQQSWTQQQGATLIVRGIRCFERSGSWACFELVRVQHPTPRNAPQLMLNHTTSSVVSIQITRSRAVAFDSTNTQCRALQPDASI